MRNYLKNPQNVLLSTVFMLFLMSIINTSGIKEIIDGMIKIMKSPNILVTDYIELSSLSSAFFNAGIMGLFSIILFVITKHEINEKTIMVLWLVCGFSFFGKNLANTIPIILGGYLYSKYKKEPFKNHVICALLGTGLAPAVSQLYYIPDIRILGFILGLIFGIIIGFCIIPISKNTSTFQSKYNLYNSGFGGGVLAMLIMALFRAQGFDFTSVNVWSSGNNDKILIFLIAISIFLIVAGVFGADCYKERLNLIGFNLSKRVKYTNNSYNEVKDYAYLNMGLLGLFSSLFMIILKVELSGPVIGGIFTIIGFGCCGKNLKSITPVMIGATIAGALSSQGLTTPNVIICILFSTCLAPVSTHYGWHWGILAGLLHIILVMNMANMHGGMNLYNNGLAGGLVVLILVPIITTIKNRTLNSIKDDEDALA